MPRAGPEKAAGALITNIRKSERLKALQYQRAWSVDLSATPAFSAATMLGPSLERRRIFWRGAGRAAGLCCSNLLSVTVEVA